MKLDLLRAVEVLADALVLGDKAAAEKWKVTDKTVRNYKERLKNDPELSALFHRKISKAQREWASARIRFLRASLSKLTELVGIASEVQHIPSVTAAIKTVGELQVAVDALGTDECSTDSLPSQQTPATSTETDNPGNETPTSS
jgi:hypothetical protein